MPPPPRVEATAGHCGFGEHVWARWTEGGEDDVRAECVRAVVGTAELPEGLVTPVVQCRRMRVVTSPAADTPWRERGSTAP
jgi:hypothetical protein